MHAPQNMSATQHQEASNRSLLHPLTSSTDACICGLQPRCNSRSSKHPVQTQPRCNELELHQPAPATQHPCPADVSPRIPLYSIVTKRRINRHPRELMLQPSSAPSVAGSRSGPVEPGQRNDRQSDMEARNLTAAAFVKDRQARDVDQPLASVDASPVP
jgi:hypothetical protein